MIDKFDGEYEFLSNFYYSPIKFEGIEYPTVEHYFQAMKSLSQEEREKIALCETPGRAKRMGRKVNLRPDWEEVKESYMYIGLGLKFATYSDLRQKLVDTYPEYLCEGTTWHDNIWGNCSCPRCINIQGQNKLGKLLMKVRAGFIDPDSVF